MKKSRYTGAQLKGILRQADSGIFLSNKDAIYYLFTNILLKNLTK